MSVVDEGELAEQTGENPRRGRGLDRVAGGVLRKRGCDQKRRPTRVDVAAEVRHRTKEDVLVLRPLSGHEGSGNRDSHLRVRLGGTLGRAVELRRPLTL